MTHPEITVKILRVAAGKIEGSARAASAARIWGAHAEAYQAAASELKALALELERGEVIRDHNGITVDCLKLEQKEVDELTTLRNTVLEYLSEIDNPVPDSTMRRILRGRLRKLTGAPDQPPPRKSRK